MRVVHVEDRFEPNAGYQINELIKEQVKLGYDIEIITSTIPIFSSYEQLRKDDEIYFNKYGVKIIRIKPMFIISSRYYFKGLFKLIDSKIPDIVFLHGIADFKDLVLFQKRKNYLIFRDCHMSWTASQNRFSHIFATLFSYTFAKIINNNHKYKKIYSLGTEEEQYLEYIGVKKSLIEKMPHGYNSNEMYYSKEARDNLRRFYNIGEKECLIGYVGKLDFAKRPDLLFDIFEMIEEEVMSNVSILFVGNFEEKYKKIFYKKYETFRYKEKCIFMVAQKYSELYKVYSTLDICFWPRQTTLSSIHAQVCRTLPVMELHESNKERVYNDRYLFEKEDMEKAREKLLLAIKTFRDVDFSSMQVFLSQRDYIKTVKKIDSDWKRYLAE